MGDGLETTSTAHFERLVPGNAIFSEIKYLLKSIGFSVKAIYGIFWTK